MCMYSYRFRMVKSHSTSCLLTKSVFFTASPITLCEWALIWKLGYAILEEYEDSKLQIFLKHPLLCALYFSGESHLLPKETASSLKDAVNDFWIPSPYVFSSLLLSNVNRPGVKNDDLQKGREGLHKARISDICYSLSHKPGKYEYVFCHWCSKEDIYTK